MYKTLISSQNLIQNIDNPDWVVLDCRSDVQDPTWGKMEYAKGHILGAVFVDLVKDLCGSITSQTGRHPLPKPETVSRFFSSCGVGTNSQVIVYDQSIGMIAARTWWTLRWLGHEHVALLDGGLTKWKKEKLPMTTAVPSPKDGNFTYSANRDMFVTTQQVEQSLKDGDCLLLDARAPYRFRGENETVDVKPGRIKDSVNHFFGDNAGEDGCLLPTEHLRKMFAPYENKNTIHTCGSGITCCHNILAMQIAGYHPSNKLYPGSWSEWLLDPSRPTAIG